MPRCKELIMLLCFSLGWQSSAKACSCINVADNFLGSVQLYIGPGYADTQIAIIEARLLDTVGGYGMKLQVLHPYYVGAFSLADTIIIWGDPGWSCRFSPVGYYHPGDTILAIINSLHFGSPATSSESSDDYYIYSCNFNYIQVRGDSVFGGNVVSFTFDGYPLTSFIDSLHTLVGTVGINNPATSMSGILTYPNPVKDLLYIDMGIIRFQEICLSLTNTSGQIVRRLRYSGTQKAEIDMQQLLPGLYFLSIEGDGKSARHYQVLKE